MLCLPPRSLLCHSRARAPHRTAPPSSEQNLKQKANSALQQHGSGGPPPGGLKRGSSSRMCAVRGIALPPPAMPELPDGFDPRGGMCRRVTADAKTALTENVAATTVRRVCLLTRLLPLGALSTCPYRPFYLPLGAPRLPARTGRRRQDDDGGAPAWSKWPSWRGQSWPPRAHRTASEGLGLPFALVGRGSAGQIPPRGRDLSARGRPSRHLHCV